MAEMVTAVFGGHIDITRRRAEGTGRAESPIARDFIRELQAEDATATPAEIRQRYQDHVRFRAEFTDDAVESEMIAILDEWLVTVVPD
jgi:hypothetical protein